MGSSTCGASPPVDADPPVLLSPRQAPREKAPLQATMSLEAQVSALSAKLAEVERRLAAVEGGREAAKPPEAVKVAEGDCRDVEGQAGDAEEDTLEYALGNTLWDAPALLFLPELGPLASTLLAVTMALLVAVQTYLSVCLLNPSSEFIVDELWTEHKLASQRWRLAEGHDYGQTDAVGTSLASRVCMEDGSLSVASTQAGLVGQISRYLTLPARDSVTLAVAGNGQTAPLNGVGPLLCVVCIFLFAVVVLKEIRRLATAMFALVSLPRGRTHMENGQLHCISLPRLAAALGAHAVQFGVAGVILYTGAMWLAFTPDIPSLILNAAALGFIMDLDGLLFEAMVPSTIHKFVAEMKPLRYKKPSVHQDSWVPLLLMGVILTVTFVQVIMPNIRDMYDVYLQICGGNLDFAVTQNPAGYVASVQTNAFSEVVQDTSIAAAAVEEIRDKTLTNPKLPLWSLAALSRSVFVSEAGATLASIAETAICQDTDTYKNGALTREFPAWYSTIRLTRGPYNRKSLAEVPFRCADYAQHCNIEGLMRVFCPITCGCVHPTSSQINKNPVGGCPKSCEQPAEQALQSLACSDQDTARSANWTAWWQNYNGLVRTRVPGIGSGPEFQGFVKRVVEGGCDALRRDPLGNDFCDKDNAFARSNGISTLMGFCPQRCCGNSSALPDCPAACTR